MKSFLVFGRQEAKEGLRSPGEEVLLFPDPVVSQTGDKFAL